MKTSILRGVLLLGSLGLGAFLFLLSCEPGNPIEVVAPDPVDGNHQNAVVDSVFVSFVDWPASVTKDTAVRLQVIVLDAKTKSSPQGGIDVVVTARPSTSAEIRDTSGRVAAFFTTSGKGTASFRLKPSQLGKLDLFVTITDSLGKSYVFTRSLSVVDGTVLPTVNKLMSLDVLTPIINADGSSKSDLKVTIKDELNHPLVGEKVEFGATGGLILASAITDGEGIAMGWIKSDRRNDTVYITATVASNGESFSESQSIVFTGIQLTIQPRFSVIEADTSHRDTITVELKDAAGRLVSNDTVLLTVSGGRTFAATGRDTLKALTNVFGQYTTWLTSRTAGDITVSTYALGASARTGIRFTTNSFVFDSPEAWLPGDGAATDTLWVTLRNGSQAAIRGAQVKWYASYGQFTGSPITTTGNTGRSFIVYRTPEGAGQAVISAEASDTAGRLLGSTSASIEIRGLKPSVIELGLSPSNIRVEVGEAVLTARAYDSKGNIVNGFLIGFRMVKSAGGGDEKLVTPMGYTTNGSLSSVFKAGSVISAYQGVKFTAVGLQVQGSDTTILVSSDTVSLTISGPPDHVSLGANIEKGVNPNDGTFALPIAAVVTDVNGNLVADGTKVYFSLSPSAYLPYFSDALKWNGAAGEDGRSVMVTAKPKDPCTNDCYEITRTAIRDYLPWTDYNNNLRLDDGEEPNPLNPTRPYRGEDRNSDGLISQPPDTYDDLNGNLTRQTGVCPLGATSLAACDLAEPARVVQRHALDSTGADSTYPDTVYADLNGNNRWDKEEICNDVNGSGWCECFGCKDSLGIPYAYELNYSGRSAGEPPAPYGKGGGVTAMIQTLNGKAVQQIWYPQTDALRIEVRIKSEANGINDAIKLILPVVK